jgi:hypothetical protein
MFRLTAALIAGLAALPIAFAAPAMAMASTATPVSMTFNEPAHPNFISGCPVFPDGACGSGEVIPFGHATEMIGFGAGCGGTCDRRTITLAQGQVFIEETAASGRCPGFCQPNPVDRGTGTLTDVIIGGTGLFEGATGNLTGTVSLAISNIQPAGASVVQLSGTITLAS